jgi:hypothetical protein
MVARPPFMAYNKVGINIDGEAIIHHRGRLNCTASGDGMTMKEAEIHPTSEHPNDAKLEPSKRFNTTKDCHLHNN